MEPIGPHHQVEESWFAALIGDLDVLATLRGSGDGVVENVLDVVPGRRVEDADQVFAQDLDLGDRAPESPRSSELMLANGLLSLST